jgi:outer membrane protein OmpA-like peptidoglycan-associated protein
MNNSIRSILLVLLSGAFPIVTTAQSGNNTANKFNRFSIAVQATHFYDLKFESYDDLQNGFSGEDMKGLNGEKTRFDMAYGVNIGYQFSPVLAVDMYGMFGSMSGANQIEYYQSDIRSLGIGANIALKTAHTAGYRFVPYVRFATGWSSYDATRFFILDDVDFSNEKGTTWHYNLGIGVNGHINSKWSVFAQSAFNIVATDAWDGYNYGAGKDHMIKTTLGVRYTFGPKSRPNLNREAAWQGKTSPELLAAQRRLSEGMKTITEKVNVLEATQNDRNKDFESELEELKNQSNPDSLLARIDQRIRQYMDEVKSGELAAVYFDFNKSDIKVTGQSVVELVANQLISNPSWKVSVSAFNDHIGNENANTLVRNARRDAVKNALIAQGISIDRIMFEEWRGIFTGNDKIDRRAELRIVK